jgi:protein phosphatase
MTLGIHYAVRSDVGLLREINEDAAYAGTRLFAVADGMGGHAAGEVASAVAIASLAPLDERPKDDQDPRVLLRDALIAANARLKSMVAADTGLDGMGTTVTALLVDDGQLGLIHIGDSRAYRFREGELMQVTHDHTLVQRLVDEGRISLDEAGVHPQRSLITRALDGRESVEFDVALYDLVPGDRYLLCSDGLSGVISEATMAEALDIPDINQSADRLVDLALRGGGPDNVTCIVADVVELPSAGAPPAHQLAGAAADAPRTVAIRTDPTAMPRGDHPAGRAAEASGLTERQFLRAANRRRRGGVSHRARGTRRRRRGIVTLVVALVLAAGLAGTWRYTQSQYYVGEHGGHVVIYQGLSGSIAGIDFSKVKTDSGIGLAELPEFEQQQVRDGITADTLRGARDIVARLQSQRIVKPATPATQPSEVTPTPSPSAT